MFNKEQNQYIAFNYDINTVYNAIISGVNSLSGFTVSQVNPQSYVIVVDKGMSLWTWGETITITLNVNQATNQTYAYFSSDSKLGTEFAAKKQNRKNIDAIIGATNNVLMSQQPMMQQQYQQPQSMNQLEPQQMYQQPVGPTPQPMPQQQMQSVVAQPMPAQSQQVAPQPIQSTQHTGDALSNNMNNM